MRGSTGLEVKMVNEKYFVEQARKRVLIELEGLTGRVADLEYTIRKANLDAITTVALAQVRETLGKLKVAVEYDIKADAEQAV